MKEMVNVYDRIEAAKYSNKKIDLQITIINDKIYKKKAIVICIHGWRNVFGELIRGTIRQRHS